MKKFTSDISGSEFLAHDRISGHTIRKPIMDLICKDYPDFNRDKNISLPEYNYYREKYIGSFLLKELGELAELKKNVLHSYKSKTSLTDIAEQDDSVLTTGQRIADKVATFGGSWTFIISFGTFLFGWILLNVFFLQQNAFDPFPFILLNLILSCIAALQAPVIMMSQNRQEQKDRDRAKKDYMINLKSELEIQMLHEKVDHLIMHQQKELIEIQKIQIDMMNDILKKVK